MGLLRQHETVLPLEVPDGPILKHLGSEEPAPPETVRSPHNFGKKEAAMFLLKSDIFKDLRQEAVHDISEIAIEEGHDPGSKLFSAGDPAEHFYILVEGRVRINIGKTNQKEYVVGNLGEAFGWSSLVGNKTYTADATCLAPTRLLKINKSDLEKVFDNHERSGRKFYMSLSRQLGQRLMDLHA
jgi:CRP-like cAMP-binding protein